MTAAGFSHEAEPSPVEKANLGLVALQSDERIEADFRLLLPQSLRLLVSRVPSGEAVTTETLGEMRYHLAAAAGLFPVQMRFDCVGYGCTSGASVIGSENVEIQVCSACHANRVTDPVRALVAACRALGVARLAFLSPYIEEVSATLRAAISDAGVATPVFGSFNEADESTVAKISTRSVADAAIALARDTGVEGVFLSCTNLNTLPVIAEVEAATGLPVLSSNSVLAWHMAGHAGHVLVRPETGKLLAGTPFPAR